MAKSSIHIKPVKGNSEAHNLRKVKLDYVRSDLTHKNLSFSNKSISDSLSELKKIVKEKTGRKMQAKATPIREGVFLFNENHTNQDIVNIADGFKNQFGILPIQIHIHRDEGHYQKSNGKWKHNYHAHIIFEWMDRTTGKSIKLDREKMSEMQTYVAKSLNMERGLSSSKKHLNSLEFKISKQEEVSSDLSIKLNKYDNLNLIIETLEYLLNDNQEFSESFDDEIQKRKKKVKKRGRRV